MHAQENYRQTHPPTPQLDLAAMEIDQDRLKEFMNKMVGEMGPR
jgi:hypothetical protein